MKSMTKLFIRTRESVARQHARRLHSIENLFERDEFGARDQFVELVDVSLVMLAVVIFRCLRGNMGPLFPVSTSWTEWSD
jgi:hypothetical protein